jgi:hypothetical protein
MILHGQFWLRKEAAEKPEEIINGWVHIFDGKIFQD